MSNWIKVEMSTKHQEMHTQFYFFLLSISSTYINHKWDICVICGNGVFYSNHHITYYIYSQLKPVVWGQQSLGPTSVVDVG